MTTDSGVCIKYYVSFVIFFRRGYGGGGVQEARTRHFPTKVAIKIILKNASFWGPQAPRPLANGCPPFGNHDLNHCRFLLPTLIATPHPE